MPRHAAALLAAAVPAAALLPAYTANPRLDGLDFYHFILSGEHANYDARAAVAAGVTLTKWNGSRLGVLDLELGVCAHNVIEWDAGSATPWPASDAWFPFDTTYFVAEGNISVTVAGDAEVLHSGDTLWLRAGTPHSPLTPVGGGRTVVDALVTPYDPQLTPAPAGDSDLSQKGDLSHRFYLTSTLTPPRGGGKGRHYPHHWTSQTASDPAVLHVWWDPAATIGLHYHAEGALYVPAWGSMCFSGEPPTGTGCLTAGEASWRRAGYAYANEGTLDAVGTEIIVLNAQSSPHMVRSASKGPFISAHHVSINYVSIPADGEL